MTRGASRLLASFLLIAAACAREETPKNAVVILVDTLRADALEQAETPVLDGLVARGDRVERAWSSGTWTAPSLVSLFTGMHVREHGWDYGFRGSRRNRPRPRRGTPWHRSRRHRRCR